MISGISCVTFTSASSLFIVISEGVEMMLLVPSLRSAWTSAAKLVPLLSHAADRDRGAGPTVELLMVGVRRPGRRRRGRVEVPRDAQRGRRQIDDAGARCRAD